MKGETIAFVVFFSAYLGVATAFGFLEPPKKGESSLPCYLAGAPLTSAEIGFTRATLVAAVSSLGLVAVALILAGWSLWPENRSTFLRWMEQMAVEYGSPMAALPDHRCGVDRRHRVCAQSKHRDHVSHPYRKPRLHLAVMVVPTLAFLAFVGLITFWMLQQTTWESAIANAWYWASWLPTWGWLPW